jgi:N-acetylneuraminic acid mutarotase
MLFGGIEDDSFSTITSDAYVYDHKKRSSKKLPNMLMPRYSFAFRKIGNRVYALGGGNSDPDGNLQFLDSCEYFDFEKQTWNAINNLPIPVISSTALDVNKTLYLFGGVC